MANTPAFDLDAFGNTPMNCMTLIAGKAASATGHVLVGHNEDDGGHVVVRHGWVPPRDWEKGAVMPAEEGCALLPQVAHTLGYYWVEYRKDVMGLSNADGFVNERGVVIVSNSMGTSREGMENADCVKDGGIAFNLRRALAERAQTARDGARILMELIDEWGYAPSGRAYTIADRDEAFMFQLARGRHYMGARVPDDAIAVMPNHFNLHGLTDYPEQFYPADVVTYAIARGWYTPAKNGDFSDFDFARAYQAEDEFFGPRNVMRQKNGLRIALDRPWSVEKEGMPFCVRANRPVTEGGVLGMTLLLHHWFGLSPSISGLVLNAACYIGGWRTLGRSFIFYSVIAGGGFSAFYAFFEQFDPLWPGLAQMPLVAAVVGALFVGIGAGLSVRAGGAPGGDDALAMALHKVLRQPIERIYLGSDLVVLALSASYLPLERLACSLLTVLLSGQIIGLIQRIPSPSARKAAALESTNK